MSSMGSVGSIGSMGSIGTMGTMGSIGSIGSVGSIGSIGSIGSTGSIGSVGSVGSVGLVGSVSSVRGKVGCGEHLCCSVPLPIGLGVSSDGPPAGKEARPPHMRAGEEEPEAGGLGWEPWFCVGSVSPHCCSVVEKSMVVVVVQGPSSKYSWEIFWVISNY